MTPRFLDELCAQLRRRGVSRRYVRRLAGELRDHYESLRAQHLRAGHDRAEAERLAEQDLGDPQKLVEEIVSRRRAGRFVREHPFLVFAVAPLPFALAIAFAFAAIGWGAYLLLVRGLEVSPTHPALRSAAHWTFYGFAYALTPLMALGYCRLAARYRCPMWMALVSCLFLCAAGGVLKLDFVVCGYTGSVKYFQRWGLDGLRLWGPLAVFAAYAGARLLLDQVRRPPLLR